MSFRPLQARPATGSNLWDCAPPVKPETQAKPLAAPVPVYVAVQSVPEGYPTPPASPDLEDGPLCLPSLVDLAVLASTGLYTPPLDTVEVEKLPLLETLQCPITVVPLDAIDFEDLDIDEEEEELQEVIEAGIESSLEHSQVETGEPATIGHEEGESTLSSSVSSPTLNLTCGSIPIPILLNTSNHIPHASTFRLATPSSLLSSLGGSRIFLLDASQTVWDRMPFSAAATAAATSLSKDTNEEDSVESLLGGEKDDGRLNGLQWGPRSKKTRDHISSIFVHPPTPEREIPPNTTQPTTIALPPASDVSPATLPFVLPDEPVASSSRKSTSPPSLAKSSSSSAPAPAPATATATPIHVLPEVRSPPRRALALAADSLQVTRGRGRRPKLFGFTEISDSSSSANSSRQGSPDRDLTPTPTQHAPIPGASIPPPRASLSDASPPPPLPSPRRMLSRTVSETSLPVVAAKPITSPTFQPPRPRRGNGLKLDFTGIIPVASEEDGHMAEITSPYSSRLIRKKSGEILKPALKYAGPLGPNGTPLRQPEPPLVPDDAGPSDGFARMRFESKSLPATPSCPKYVHFDTQLERVKLFLQDQKPQVVSRDGSPTAEYTTSEGEEYPFPSTDEEDAPVRKVLQIKLPNFPAAPQPDSELYLESLFLEEDRRALKGIIMVKNIAFQKWVAARFTLDFWQTTSEVTAQHKDSVRGGAYDRFTFIIKLNDVLTRITEKTLFIALRYHTDNREIWDSNGGQNYQVLFETVRPPSTSLSPKRANSLIQPGMGKAVGGRTSQWSVTGGGKGDDRLADLRAKLSHLTGGDPDMSPPPASPSRTGPLSPHKGMINFSAAFASDSSPRKSSPALELPAAGPNLASRYDFGIALKSTTRKTSPSGANRTLSPMADLPDVKTGLLSFPSSTKANNGHAATEFYSPKFSPNTLPTSGSSADHLFSPPTATSTLIDTPTKTPTSAASSMKESPTASGLNIHGVSTPSFRDDVKPAPVKNNVITPPKAGSANGTATYSSPSHDRPAQARVVSPSPSLEKDADDAPHHVEHASDSSTSSTTVSGSSRTSPSAIPSTQAASILNGTAIANRSPVVTTPPKSASAARWSPTSKFTRNGDDMSLASYSSFIEQFCWGGAASTSPPLVPRRSSSTSALSSYFEAGSPPQGDMGRSPTSPNSTASFHTSYTSHGQDQGKMSPASTSSFVSYGTPGSYSLSPPSHHHRSSSFTSPMTNERGHMTQYVGSPRDDSPFGGLDGEVGFRPLGVERAPMAC